MNSPTRPIMIAVMVVAALGGCARGPDLPTHLTDAPDTRDRGLPDRGGPRRGGTGAAAAIGALLPLLPMLAAAASAQPAPPASQRPTTGAPPAGESRMVPAEIVVEVSPAMPPQAVAALEQRQGLAQLEQFTSGLSATTVIRARIIDGRPIPLVIAALETEPSVLFAQPNYRFALQAAGADTDLQYALAKLRLPAAHTLATGGGVLAAVIDSDIDPTHPELAGSIAGRFDALDTAERTDGHGTAIAGLIAAHGKLTGAAPAARLLAVRAFDADAAGAAGGSFAILKGLDWASTQGARVINMSFAGPPDPALHRALAAAHDRSITLVAAAGNAGPASPPLYPGADQAVIAVSATDSDDALFADANRGSYIAVAAPGVDLLVAAPNGAYRVLSGTSLSAAEITGIAALMLQRSPDLSPDAVRARLLATAAPLPGAQNLGLADAYRAVAADRAVQSAAALVASR